MELPATRAAVVGAGGVLAAAQVAATLCEPNHHLLGLVMGASAAIMYFVADEITLTSKQVCRSQGRTYYPHALIKIRNSGQDIGTLATQGEVII